MMKIGLCSYNFVRDLSSGKLSVEEMFRMFREWGVSHVEIPTTVSLAVIFGVLLLSVLLSVASTKSEARKKNARKTPEKNMTSTAESIGPLC